MYITIYYIPLYFIILYYNILHYYITHYMYMFMPYMFLQIREHEWLGGFEANTRPRAYKQRNYEMYLRDSCLDTLLHRLVRRNGRVLHLRFCGIRGS